jgi:hypothetical protein
MVGSLEELKDGFHRYERDGIRVPEKGPEVKDVLLVQIKHCAVITQTIDR